MEDSFHLGIKALIKNDKGEILLLKVNNKKLIDYNEEPYWDIPGGRVKRGSSVEDTLKHEIYEETGVKEITSIKPLEMVLSNIRIPVGETDVGLILSIYECKIDTNVEIKLSDEHVEFGWFTPAKAGKLLCVKYPEGFTLKLQRLNSLL